jgi:hypothetical protein
LLFSAKSDVNRGLRIVVHTYDFVTPRNAAAGPGFDWVRCVGVRIPQDDWAALGRTLRCVRSLIPDSNTEPSLRVVDTQGTLTPAKTTDTGPTEHWQNEIHPTRTGYRLLGDVWERKLEEWFGR